MTVVAAELNAQNKKEVVLTVSGAELGKEYTLVAQGLKIKGEAQKEMSASFKMPGRESLYNAKLSIEGNKTVIKADNAASVLVTFELTDTEGKQVNADNVEVAFTSTFGTFAEKRVTVQNGKASALFNSEVLDSDKPALLTATVVEASNKNLINIKAEKNLLLSPNPDDGIVDEKVGVTLTDVAAEMADRVILYFNKDVDVSKYVKADTKSEYDATKLEITIKDNAANNDTSAVGGDRTVIGLKEVPGNSKALYAILDTTKTLTDNSKIIVNVKDKTGTLTTDSTKSTVLTDARRPAILGVSRDGLNKVVVTFSEPIVNDNAQTFSATKLQNWVLDGVRLDNVAKWGASTKANVGTFNVTSGEDARNVVTIELGKDTNSGKQIYLSSGKHSIQGSNIGDWANTTDLGNNVINTQTLDFDIPEDVEVPTAKVEVQSPEQYVVTFDKEILENDTDLGSVLKLQKYDVKSKEWKDETSQTISVRAVSNTKNKFVVETTKDWTDKTVYNTPSSTLNYYNDQYRLAIPAGKITNVANGKTNSAIELILDGPMKTPDVTSPKIDVIKELTQGVKYSVTMSEPVKFPEDTNATLAEGQKSVPKPTAEFIKKDNSITVKATVAKSADPYDKIIDVTPDSKLEAGEWTLVVRSISDDVGNTAASDTKDFTVKYDETVIEKDFRVVWAGADSDNNYSNGLTEIASNDGKDAIYVKFSQPVKATGGYVSALTTTNYTLNGNPLPTGTQIVANIAGYDDKDAYTDSITIVLPDGTLTKSINSTVITISGYIQNEAGKALANGGLFKLSYNHEENVTISGSTNAEKITAFKAALNNEAVRSIDAAGVNLSAEDVVVDRLVDIKNLGNAKSLTVNTTEGGKMVIAGSVAGNLTVNTPNADFEVATGTTVSGTTEIKDVLSSTFINNGTLGAVKITDANGVGFENAGTVGAVTVETTGAVTLKGNIANVEVTKAANLKIEGTVTNLDLVAEAKGVKVELGTGVTAPNVTNNTGETVKVGDKDVPVVKTLNSIAIKTPATKLVYTVGDTLDITGLEIEGTYSDNTKKNEVVAAKDVTGFDSSKAVAKQTLTVTVGGKTTTYDVEIKAAAPKSTDASITGITVKGTNATVSADAKIYNVELAIGTDLTKITAADVVATAKDSKASVGTATKVNDNQWTIVVTAEDGTTSITYTVNLTVAAAPKSTDASITGITVKGTNATVSSDAKIYNVELATGTDLTKITATDVVATAKDSKASAGTATKVNDNQWTIVVTAEDGTTSITYTVNLTVAAAPKSTDASITGITVKGTNATVSADTKVYNVELAKGTVLTDIKAADVVAAAKDSKASVGTATAASANQWTIVVTAEDGTTSVTYTVNLTVATA